MITKMTKNKTKIVQTYIVQGDVSLRYWFCLRLYEALKQADLDQEEIQRLNLIIKKLEEDLENSSKSVN